MVSSGGPVWDESTRPVGPPAPAGQAYTEHAVGRHLVDVHDHLRAELARLQDLLRQVTAGTLPAGEARGALNRMTMRQHHWALGAYCAAYCAALTQHHTLEDRAVFPHLRTVDAGLAPVVDRLEQEHEVIHGVLEALDRALVAYLEAGDPASLDAAMELLAGALLSHLAYEERELVEPLSRYGFYPGQIPAGSF